jgi:N-acylneuraminate cytidylyltransferase
MTKACFIIPARGGSKGIPHKNIKSFRGKPLIAWTIEECLKTKLGNVYVSTDSKEIYDVALEYGAFGVERPHAISGDNSSSEDALIDVLGKLPKQPEDVFFMQCTSPWITAKDIKRAYIEHNDSCGYATIFAKQNHSYVHKKCIKTPFFCKCLLGNKRLMRQQMDKYIVEVGAYICDSQRLIETKSRFCGETQLKFSVIDRALPPEIDSIEDWEFNEKYFDKWRGLK